MTDRDVLEDFRDVVGCGTVRDVRQLNPKLKQVYEWTISDKPSVYKLLLQLRRHLHSRRAAKCDEALELLRKDSRVVLLYT